MSIERKFGVEQKPTMSRMHRLSASVSLQESSLPPSARRSNRFPLLTEGEAELSCCDTVTEDMDIEQTFWSRAGHVGHVVTENSGGLSGT